jgi:hypothetical protein
MTLDGVTIKETSNHRRGSPDMSEGVARTLTEMTTRTEKDVGLAIRRSVQMMNRGNNVTVGEIDEERHRERT